MSSGRAAPSAIWVLLMFSLILVASAALDSNPVSVQASEPICPPGGPMFPPIGSGVAFHDASHAWIATSRFAGSSCAAGPVILFTPDGGTSWAAETVPLGISELTDVAFVNDSDGWAVGSGIVATTNGGRTWIVQSTPNGAGTLSSVAFANTSDGWAVGQGSNGAVILSTASGGLSWSSSTVPALGTFSNLSAVATANASDAWAVGSTCNSGACSGAIVATTNGGMTWFPQTVPSGVENLSAVTFSSASDGWAAGTGSSGGGQILSTTDGGVTWTPESLPTGVGSLFGVAFVDGSHGWVVGEVPAPPGGAPCSLVSVAGCPGLILGTADGGATWSPETIPSNEPTLSAIGFSSASAGLVLPFNFVGVGAVLSTADAGATWRSSAVTGSVPTGFFGISALSASTAFALGQDCDASLGCGGTIFGLTNGGATWTPEISLPISPANGELSGVAFPAAGFGWGVGRTSSGGVILATANGGTSWNPQTVPIGIADLAGVTFVNASTGWAVGTSLSAVGPGSAVILGTTDGGATWNQESVPSNTGGLSAVTFIDNVHGWAIGGGEILTTSNGGETWGVESVGNPYVNLVGAFFLDPLDGWAVGTSYSDSLGAVVLHTTDGGMTWSPETLPAAVATGFAVLYSIDFVNASDGWAVGTGQGGAVILATTDSGNSWNVQETFAAPQPQSYWDRNDFYGVDFIDNSNGWVVGSSDLTPIVLRTTNGGATWMVETNSYSRRAPNTLPPTAPVQRHLTRGTPPPVVPQSSPQTRPSALSSPPVARFQPHGSGLSVSQSLMKGEGAIENMVQTMESIEAVLARVF